MLIQKRIDPIRLIFEHQRCLRRPILVNIRNQAGDRPQRTLRTLGRQDHVPDLIPFGLQQCGLKADGRAGEHAFGGGQQARQRLFLRRINQQQASAADGVEEVGQRPLLGGGFLGDLCARLVRFRNFFLHPALRVDHAVHVVPLVFIDQLGPFVFALHQLGVFGQNVIPAAGDIHRHLGHDDVLHIVLHRVFHRLLEVLRHQRDGVSGVF